MILAGIDIGTNTLRLLIAEAISGSIREIHSDRRITRLGEKLDGTGLLSPEARQRSLAALAGFRKRIDEFGVTAVRAVGTSALRQAENAGPFIAEVRERTGIAVQVITGEEEARLTVLGVFAALRGVPDAGLDEAMIVDIGGGSTEIITRDRNGKTNEASLPLGAVYLTERFFKHDPAFPEELERLRQWIQKGLNALPALDTVASGRLLVGTAGTVTTLAAMDLRLDAYDPVRIHRWALTREAISALVLQLGRSTISERRSIPGLERGREDIILAGALVMEEIMRHFGFEKALVSDWGLREGILLDLADEMSGGKTRCRE